MDRSIGISYAQSIGKTYVGARHSSPVTKIHDPKIWDRILVALKGIGIVDNQQTHIAKLIGIAQPSVSGWESHTSMPSLANVRKLAIKTNVCVDWLYTERGPKHPGPPMEPVAERLWSAWGQLSDEEKSELAGYAVVKAAANTTHLAGRKKAV